MENKVHPTFRIVCSRIVKGYHELLDSSNGKMARKWLNNRCITDELITKYHLGYGSYCNRTWITIPLYDKYGFYGVKFRRFPDTDKNSTAKYINYCPHHVGISPYKATEALRIRPKDILLAEGEFDSIAAETQPELPFTIGLPSATFFKDEWLEYLESASVIYLCFDNDEAGRRGIKNATEKITKRFPDKEIREIKLPLKINDLTDYLIKEKYGKSKFN